MRRFAILFAVLVALFLATPARAQFQQPGLHILSGYSMYPTGLPLGYGLGNPYVLPDPAYSAYTPTDYQEVYFVPDGTSTLVGVGRWFAPGLGIMYATLYIGPSTVDTSLLPLGDASTNFGPPLPTGPVRVPALSIMPTCPVNDWTKPAWIWWVWQKSLGGSVYYPPNPPDPTQTTKYLQLADPLSDPWAY